MSLLNGIDSDDDDIFEVLRIKPVAQLTRQQAIEIRNRVLEKEAKNSNEILEKDTTVNKCCKRKSIEIEDDNSSSSCTRDDRKQIKKNVNPIKINSSPGSSKSSPSKQITDYFSPVRNSSVNNKNVSNTDYKLAIDAQDLVNGSAANVAQILSKTDNENASYFESELEKEIKTDDSVTVNDLYFSDFERSSSASAEQQSSTAKEYSYFYSQSLKRIIHHVLKNQLLLEEQTVKEGKIFSKLFLKEEYECFEKFFQFDEKACSLYARMLCRKRCWHRVSKITYPDISNKIEEVFMVLVKNKFIDCDIMQEKFEVQLELLTAPEIKLLSKRFHVNVASSKKENYIDAFVKSSREQRSVVDMWKKNNATTNVDLLKKEIKAILGMCIKLNKTVLDTFNKLLLLFSLTHDVGEEDNWGSQIRMMTDVYNSTIHFPNYVVKPTVIFEDQNDFISYQNSVFIMEELDTAVTKKNHKDFFSIGQIAMKKFQKAIENQGFQERFQDLPPFLRRYNAGSVYARILTIYCDKFRKKKDPEELVRVLNLLINQDLFLVRKKGCWYIMLVQAYEELGRQIEAVNSLLSAMKDPNISEIDRLILQQKGRSILNKKKNGIADIRLRHELEDACLMDVTEPSSVEITAKSLSINKPGFKTVYVQQTGTEKTYSSVEEHAINYYKNHGFVGGIHAEGSLIQTIYFLVFFDIIYEISPPGVFQSPYQDKPLDFFSSSFYLNRKEAIDRRLEEMRKWSISEFSEKISNVYKKYNGVCCVVNWKHNFDMDMFCDIIKCLGIPKFTDICARLIRNFKVYHSGFPDLTLWNPETRRCKFVEVKGPNDKLSPNQKIWLDFLKKLHIDCEVCNVKNIGSKRLIE